MRDLYLAWLFSGGRACPYRTKHVLDEGFVPLDPPPGVAGVPRPPRSRRRLRNVVLAFSRLAEQERVEMAMAQTGRLV